MSQSGGAFLPNEDVTFGGAVTFSGGQTNTGAASYTGTLSSTGTLSATGAIAVAATSGTFAVTNTLTGSAYGASSHEDEIYSKITLTPTSTVTAANGLNAIRGEVNLTSAKSLTSGFVTGVYGRGNIFGTVAIGSGDLAAVYGKFDLNGSTLTSGHIAPVQSNIVNPPASAATTGAVALFYGESASGTKINAGVELYMASNFAFVMTDVNTSNYLPAITSTTLDGLNIKVQLNGTTYYIKTGAAA